MTKPIRIEVGSVIPYFIWCNDCCDNFFDTKVIKLKKGKRGTYQPYRDTLDSEPYTYDLAVVKCPKCNQNLTVEVNKCYHMDESDMQKYGYKGANYE